MEDKETYLSVIKKSYSTILCNLNNLLKVATILFYITLYYYVTARNKEFRLLIMLLQLALHTKLIPLVCLEVLKTKPTGNVVSVIT